jgi:chemosensory pili system protein ChpA (sensor histidine kinase/response regulator)
MAQVIKGNYNALVWLQDELQTALEQALAAMNRYIDESQEEALLVECTEALFQVKAALEMTNITGGMMLTEELQHCLGALRSQSGEEKEHCQDVILRALLLMPNYLKLLSHDFEDHPLSLIDNINELRLARQAEPLAEETLFEADLTIALPDSIAPNPKRKLPNISVEPHKLSQVYQLMLLNWLRQNDVETLRKLLGIVRYLRTSSQEDKAALFWWGAEGMLEAMVQEGLDITPTVKQLTGKLAPLVKVHNDQGESVLIQSFPAALFKQLLLMVAKATSHGPQVTLLKISLGLYFFDHRQQIYGMSDNALGDAHQALIE